MNPYATNKLAEHPEVLQQMRDTGEGQLITVHLMPQNVCNQRCSFCSYRMVDNKNSENFDEGKYIPWKDMEQLLDDFATLGVRGVELTGGGEPLAYPEINALLMALHSRGFAIGLVTNGTLYNRVNPHLLRLLRWARISIDAASRETYAVMRQSSGELYDRAWGAVSRIVSMREKMHPDFRLGVGFVLANENIDEVYKFVRMAKEHGAGNVRLSLTFSDQHLDYFNDDAALVHAVKESKRAKEDFDSDTFTVHNLMPTRYQEQVTPVQDYRRCPTKDVLCVVEGEGNVYTCCTFTGSKRGLYGNIHEHPRGFRGVWEDNVELRKNWDSRQKCQVACLYRDRNLAMNELIDNPPIHTEFI